MKQFLNQACYIWTTPFESGTDLYRRFRKKLYWNPKSSTTVTLRIAADSTCAVDLNGRRCFTNGRLPAESKIFRI